MKSIFLFCEYGVSVNTIINLDNEKIGLEDLNNDINILDKYLGSNSVKKLKISQALDKVNKTEKEYSVYELIKYGLSKNIIDKLYGAGITIEDINETMKEKYHITPAKNTKILNAYNKMAMDLNIKEELSKEIILMIIKREIKTKVTSKENIKKILEDKRYKLEKFEELFSELLNESKIVYENDGYRIAYPKLMAELPKVIKNKRHYDMVIKKLSGYTLEQIGKEYNITRERVRQIITKELKKIHYVEEEIYKKYIENYDFKEDLFSKLFNLDKYVYYYLREKYNHGELSPSELLDDDRLSSEQIEILRKEYNIIRYNDENIIADTIPILLAYLKREDRRIEYDELIMNYNHIISEYNLNLNILTKADFRNINSRLTRSNYILDTIGKNYRYYNCNDLEKDDIKELKEMLDIERGIYSTKLFFRDNPLLMKKLDIRDEYELHNLCKKVLGNFNKNIVYSRMPDIFVKCNNKLEFVEEQIRELAPINIDEFVSYIYNNYGHRKSSFKSYVLSNFSQYINLEVLIYNVQLFDDKQLNVIKKKLTEDIYPITTIKEILTECLDVNDFQLLNSINLSKLGYKLRGNYIMKDNISNLENYLRNIIETSEYYEIPQEMKKIGSTYSAYLCKFIYDKVLFKISDEKYITMRKLNKMGIYIEDINNFIENIEKIIPENKYFNLYTLNTDFKNKILNYKFPACFYENLIMIIPNVKSFRIKNNTMFIKTKDSTTREKFINSFINTNKKYIKDIRNEIKEIYNIDVEEYYIRQFINRKRFYLDSSTDCVYESREKYEEEINQWNIMKYIDID